MLAVDDTVDLLGPWSQEEVGEEVRGGGGEANRWAGLGKASGADYFAKDKLNCVVVGQAGEIRVRGDSVWSEVRDSTE